MRTKEAKDCSGKGPGAQSPRQESPALPVVCVCIAHTHMCVCVCICVHVCMSVHVCVLTLCISDFHLVSSVAGECDNQES